MSDVFNSGNALVFHFEEIAAALNRKPQPERIVDTSSGELERVTRNEYAQRHPGQVWN